ncbi:MRN complex-interacting protein [Electrophorus electricus]|uniref:MRN complex-interacting protein n=1 Tax=Electrophorus electricus TaxID=8005 RepID=UPI0015D08E80|nr:MRN complex-interacting protein [Electrophorus electricus]
MVQDFHVLRCFSCQIFQVQQVKKSKKWSCKMCGEKQSLIKEYGRGTGADCRRHVQKLNLLRGELLEVENEKTWTQWEKEKECEAEEGFGGDAQSCEKQGVSRWSKFLDQMDSRPRDDEDNEEDENVCTGRERFRSRHNIRKRKKSITSGGAGGHSTVCEAITACRRPKELLFEPQHDRYALSGYDSGANIQQPSAKVTTKHPSVSASNVFAATSSFMSLSETNMASGGSKWTRFLTTATVEEDKREDDNYSQMSAKAADAEVHHSLSTLSPGKHIQVIDGNAGNMGSGDRVCGRSLLDKELGLCNRTTERAFEKLSHCLTGTTSNQSSSPIFKSEPLRSKKPICLQPVPVKRTSPALSLRTFFYTDEDFDDTF